MNPIRIVPPQVVLLTFSLLLAGCGRQTAAPESSPHEHGAAEAPHTETPLKGPHGGRLLQDGEFALEVTIFERGVPPEFRVYPSLAGKPLAPTEVELTVELRRLNGLPGGVTDTHVFRAKDDYLLGAAEVYEPHSFEVRVRARHDGKVHEWSYDSPEARVDIATDMATASGLQFATAGSGVLHETLPLYGRIEVNPERMREVTARFPGIVRSVSVKPGDTVRQGQVLARIESNESLQLYPVTAPMAGTLTVRHTNPGESAGSEVLFGIADFSTVRAELKLFPRDRSRIKPGQVVVVHAADGGARGEGRVSAVTPLGASDQSLVARVLLDNADGRWTPGQFVNGSVAVGASSAALVVPATAVQTLGDREVVFVNEGEGYQALLIELGRRDDRNFEVLKGLQAGARLVVGNSYLVKADIEKSGASHDH